jgi:hypothetical protein
MNPCQRKLKEFSAQGGSLPKVARRIRFYFLHHKVSTILVQVKKKQKINRNRQRRRYQVPAQI